MGGCAEVALPAGLRGRPSDVQQYESVCNRIGSEWALARPKFEFSWSLTVCMYRFRVTLLAFGYVC